MLYPSFGLALYTLDAPCASIITGLCGGSRGLSTGVPSSETKLIQYLLSLDAHCTVCPCLYLRNTTGKSTSHLPVSGTGEAEIVISLSFGLCEGGGAFKWKPTSKAITRPTMPAKPKPSCHVFIGLLSTPK